MAIALTREDVVHLIPCPGVLEDALVSQIPLGQGTLPSSAAARSTTSGPCFQLISNPALLKTLYHGS